MKLVNLRMPNPFSSLTGFRSSNVSLENSTIFRIAELVASSAMVKDDGWTTLLLPFQKLSEPSPQSY